MKLSVIICSHNPREEYLGRVLHALKGQTLDPDQWELLLIDNASREPLEGKWDLSWQPHGEIIREEELGLTAARVRGIRESSGETLVFVDDDNVLNDDFLEMALEIAQKWFCLGVWGGSVLPEFEQEPAGELLPYLSLLALVSLDRVHFTTEVHGPCPRPVGAGLCIRRHVAMRYVAEVSGSAVRMSLDRKGASLISSGDEDLRSTATQCGLGMGMFPELKLIHLIPSTRVQIPYLVRLYEDIQYSQMVLASLQKRQPFLSPKGLWAEFRFQLSQMRRLKLDRLMRSAHRRASARFRKWQQSLQTHRNANCSHQL